MSLEARRAGVAETSTYIRVGKDAAIAPFVQPRHLRLKCMANAHPLWPRMKPTSNKKPTPHPSAIAPVLRRTRGPSPQKTELTRQEILSAALDEFTEVGIAKATMDKIAKRAKLAKGTLYLHFANKEALLQGALQATIAHSALASIQTPRMPQESMKDYITRLVVPPMEHFYLPARASLARLVLGEARSHPSLMQLYYQQVFAPWHQHFEQLFNIAKKEGELKGITPAVASQLLAAPFWISLVHDAMSADGTYPGATPAQLTRAQIGIIFGQKTPS